MVEGLGFRVKILGTLLGLYRDNRKENGNYCNILGYILGLYKDNRKENGNYYFSTPYWVAVKELTLSYHNGCIYTYIN